MKRRLFISTQESYLPDYTETTGTTHTAFWTSCGPGDSCISRTNSCRCYGIMKYTKSGKFYKPVRNEYSNDKVCQGFFIKDNKCHISTDKQYRNLIRDPYYVDGY